MRQNLLHARSSFVVLFLLLCVAGFHATNARDSAKNTPSQTLNVNFSKQTYTYKSVKDCKIQADVYRKSDGIVRPVIFWIHGGALIMGSRTGLHPDQLERYLKAGYTVISIDYRLAPETKLKG